MKTAIRLMLLISLGCACLVFSPVDANAYIGPGVGITAIGTVIAFIGAIIFAIVGFVWYPVKRLLGAFRSKSANRREAQKASS